MDQKDIERVNYFRYKINLQKIPYITMMMMWEFCEVIV